MQHRPVELKLSDIVRLVGSGRMSLPQFQREFVWDPNKVVELLDSISHGWPIGSLLLLEGPQAFATKDFQDGPHTDREGTEFYVLDGQQRITSIYHALTDRSDVVYLVDLEADSAELEQSFFWKKRDKYKPDPSGAVMPVMLAVNEHYFSSVINNMTSARASRARKVRRDKLGYLLGDQYSVSATLMTRDIELEALARIFETINRTGVRLDAFDLMVSVLYPKGFHLRDHWDSAVAEYPILKSMKTGGLEILKLIALWRRDLERNSNSPKRVTGVRQRDILNVPGDFVIEKWRYALRAYVAALNVLKNEFGVLDGGSKPSDAMVLTFAYVNGTQVRTDKFLSRWYWRSIMDQRYAQGANTQILTDLNNFPGATPDPEALPELLVGALSDPARRNRILRLGIHGLLVVRGALDPVTAEPLRAPIEEIPFHQLMKSSLRGKQVETLTVDNLLLNRGSVKVLIDRKDHLSREALASQGFPADLAGRNDLESRSYRTKVLSSWFEELS